MSVWDFTAQEASRKGELGNSKFVQVSCNRSIIEDSGTGKLKSVSRFSFKRLSLVYPL